MQVCLAHQPIAKGAIEGGGEHRTINEPGELDQRARRSRCGKTRSSLAIDQIEMVRCVNGDADSADVAIPKRHEVIRRHQPQPIERMESSRSWPTQPARLTNVGDQSCQRSKVVYLEAALDPAPKLCGELTVDDRQVAVFVGHPTESIVDHFPRQPFDDQREGTEARSV